MFECIYNEKELSLLASACAGFYPEPSWKKASHNICTEGRIISGYPQGVAHASVINYIRCSYSLHSFACSCTSNPLDHIFIFVSIIKTTTSNIRISSSLYVSLLIKISCIKIFLYSLSLWIWLFQKTPKHIQWREPGRTQSSSSQKRRRPSLARYSSVRP